MPKVLYIEDNFDNRLLVRRILMASDYDFDVVEADNAEAGISMARAMPPDIILMDISMPGMDGLTATRQLRSIDKVKHIPIVAITANAMDGDKERTLLAGCDGYIIKPIDVDKLPDEVFSYIRSRNERGTEPKPFTRTDTETVATDATLTQPTVTPPTPNATHDVLPSAPAPSTTTPAAVQEPAPKPPTETAAAMPVVEAAPATPAGDATPPTEPSEAHVLVVEDNVPNFVLIARMLAFMGVQRCEWKTSGWQVVQFADTLPRVDLILMDIRLPYEDGYQALQKLRANAKLKDTVVCAVTAEASEDQMRRAKKAGFNGFLGKPLDPDKFPSQIRRLLAREEVWEWK